MGIEEEERNTAWADSSPAAGIVCFLTEVSNGMHRQAQMKLSDKLGLLTLPKSIHRDASQFLLPYFKETVLETLLYPIALKSYTPRFCVL